MFSHNGKISVRQVMILLILQMFNMNMLIMPRICTHYLGRNGYVAPIVAIILGSIYLLFITSLTMRFPNLTFVEIVEAILPRWLAYILIAVFAARLIICTGLEVRMFSEMISQVMLPKTPISVLMILLLLTVAYLVKSGVEATGRMGEILIYFISIPLIISLLIILFRTDYKEVLPLFQMQLGEAGVGTLLISAMFIPIEVLLMLNGLMKKPKSVRKAGIWAIAIVGVIQGILTLLCVTQNGLQETQQQIWPVLVLMKSMGLNDTVVENQEVLMLIVWIFSVYMSVSVYIYVISLIGSRTCKFKRENVFVLPVLPIVLLIALYPHDLGVVYNYYLKFEYYFGFWFVVPIPLILLLIAKIRGIKE